MTTQNNPRDWILLSAYIDGELNDNDFRQVEARLRTDENLRTGLESLRLTRAVLRSQPALRAPRNFTLTPQMAGASRRMSPAPVFPIMRLASVLATFFLILISVGNLLATRMQPVLVSQSNAVQQPAIGMGGGGGGGGFEAELDSSLPEELPAEPQGTSAASDLAAGSLQVEPVPTETDIQAKVAVPSPAPDIQPQVEALQQAPQEIAPLAAAESEVSARQERAMVFSVIGILQVILAFLAIFTGAIAIYLYRSTR